MRSEGKAIAEVDYVGIVARHLETRLSAFGEEKVDRVLARAGLLRTGALVSNLDGSALDAGSSFRYKRAVKDVLGDAPYVLTKVNFILAGCRCEDCRSGMEDAGPRTKGGS